MISKEEWQKYGLAFSKAQAQKIPFSGAIFTQMTMLQWKGIKTWEFTQDFSFPCHLLPDLCLVIFFFSFKYEQGPSRHAELTANTGEKSILARLHRTTWLQNCSRLTAQTGYANWDVTTQGDNNGLF